MNSFFPGSSCSRRSRSAAVITLFTLRSKALSSFDLRRRGARQFRLQLLHLRSVDTTAAPEFTWLDIAPIFHVPLGLTLDQLSRTMLLVVTGVGALIHIYSLGYMRDDEGKSRYFAALSLFMFSMLGIVLANNFVMMFIFWELVGVHVLSADRSLVRPRRRGRRREESVPHQSHRRFRIHARHPDGLDRDRLGRFRRNRAANCRSSTSHRNVISRSPRF